MKLIAKIEEENYEINIKKDDSKVFAEIDGREYELESSEPEKNLYLLKHNNNIYEVFVSPKSKSDEPFKVKVDNEELEVNLIDPKKLRGAGTSDANADGIVEIKTAMPGKIVRLLLEEGNEVSKGQGVIIVEAMKMQNEMKSPKDGVIKEIKFNEGETVNAGDVLVIIE